MKLEPDRPVTIAPSGHWLYLRRRLMADPEGGIVLPERLREDWVGRKAAVYDVIAKGPKVGHRISKRERSEWKKKTGEKLPSRFPDNFKGETMVMIPRDIPFGMHHSPWCDYEFFVKEWIPLAAFEETEQGAEHAN